MPDDGTSGIILDLFQKWFATGEAIAHLRYLEEEGRVFRNAESKMTTYTLVTKKENNPPFRG